MGMTLRGPFSITLSRMVAIRFAGRHGMLIVVDVDATYYSPTTFSTSSFSPFATILFQLVILTDVERCRFKYTRICVLLL